MSLDIRKFTEALILPIVLYGLGLLTVVAIDLREYLMSFVIIGGAFAYMILTSKILYKHFTTRGKTK